MRVIGVISARPGGWGGRGLESGAVVACLLYARARDHCIRGEPLVSLIAMPSIELMRNVL